MVHRNGQCGLALIRTRCDLALRVIEAQIHAESIAGLERKPKAGGECVVIAEVSASPGTWVSQKRELISVGVQVF